LERKIEAKVLKEDDELTIKISSKVMGDTKLFERERKECYFNEVHNLYGTRDNSDYDSKETLEYIY
jgi:hypothetical protein